MKENKKIKSKRSLAENSIVHAFLGILGFFWILPIFFVILTSFRAEGGSYKSYVMPRGYTLDNYRKLFDSASSLTFGRWFFNTLIVALCSCVLTTFFVLCVAYVTSRLRFKMRRRMMNIALILGMFPGFMSMYAVYYILKGFGLLETGPLKLVALVMVYSGGAGLGYLVAKGFFDTIPKTVDEAAFIDGATKWDVFCKITVPLSRPIIVITLLNAFMGPWVDYIFAKVILGQDRRYYTIAIGLWTMLEKEFVEYYYTQFFAGCVLISIPISIIFLVSQKFYADEMSGAVKG
ncbi:MAG: ABC transporter permease subunit [Hungatella sp.]|nr:ABC transporter permease subunit [Hungatella sp.]MDR2021896.1 ABC transporter permease subunit [Hungatella sp.]